LQKLCYYCQAWALVWDEEPLFKERIEAWSNGPVIPELYKSHQGKYKISSLDKGDPRKLSSSQRETVDAVLEFYGRFNSQQLSDLTHLETPWKEARQG